MKLVSEIKEDNILMHFKGSYRETNFAHVNCGHILSWVLLMLMGVSAPVPIYIV